MRKFLLSFQVTFHLLIQNITNESCFQKSFPKTSSNFSHFDKLSDHALLIVN